MRLICLRQISTFLLLLKRLGGRSNNDSRNTSHIHGTCKLWYAKLKTNFSKRLLSHWKIAQSFDRAKSQRAFHEREWSRVRWASSKKKKGKIIIAENYTVLRGGDAVCKTSSINERMACGRHIITREATPAGEKLLNPSALLYRAPGRKCDNERDSETPMRASASDARRLARCISCRCSQRHEASLWRTPRDSNLCDLRNEGLTHSWKCITASASGRLIGIIIFLRRLHT